MQCRHGSADKHLRPQKMNLDWNFTYESPESPISGTQLIYGKHAAVHRTYQTPLTNAIKLYKPCQSLNALKVQF